MNLIAIIVGCLAGIGMGFLIPTIPYTASNYLAIGIVAAMDTVIGGFASNLKGTFDIKVFVTGFFTNTVLAILLTFSGQRLNVDIYLAAIIVFVGRMLANLGIIRRIYIEKLEQKKSPFKRKIDVEKKIKVSDDEPKII